MNHLLNGRPVHALFFLFPVLAGAQTLKLLPAESVARQIQAIRGKLSGTLQGPYDSEEQAHDKADREKQLGQLKGLVSGFVMAQLEAEPRLFDDQLRAQLALVLGIPESYRRAFVFRNYFNRDLDPAVWTIVYATDAYYGLGGSRIVAESYSVEKGKARLTGRAGSELDGFALEAERVYNPNPLSISVLIHGIYQWGSGRSLPAKAVLYGVSQTGISALWTLEAPGLEFVGQVNTGFVIQYHDEMRLGANLPSTVVDVYLTDKESPRRVVHEFID